MPRILALVALGSLLACGPASPEPRADAGLRPMIDAGVSVADTGTRPDTGSPADTGASPRDTGTTPPRDAGPGGTVDPRAAEDIATLRAAPPGPVDIPFATIMVTAVRSEIGNDAAGFFVQATRPGPALFIAHDPAAAGLSPGSLVTFRATDCGDSYSQRIVTGITGLEVVGNGDISTLVQDVSEADDLVNAIGDYEAELLTASLTMVSGMTFAGTGFVAAAVNTEALRESALKLRLPEALQERLNLAAGCTLVFTGPMWRFRDTPQLSAYTEEHLSDIQCPGTSLIEAQATRMRAVRLTFNRALNPDSLREAGDQFTIPGLAVSAAQLTNETTVRLTTATQESNQAYTVTVDDTLVDAQDNPLDPAGLSAEFTGFTASLQLGFSEINANMTSGCDRIELRAIGSGNPEGFLLRERTTTVLTFPAMQLNDGDVIVVHFNSASQTCNPDGLTSENTAMDQINHASHYATAWDVWSDDRGLTATDNVLQVRADGVIQDAVLLADEGSGTAAAGSERAAAQVAEAGEWTTRAGQVPDGGFVDDSFCAHAVIGLGDEDRSGVTSIQRLGGQDSNHAGDWSPGPIRSTWGAPND